MDKFVRVEGIVSKHVEQLLISSLGKWPIYSNSCILFINYSDFDIPLGARFLYLVDNESREIMYPIQGELVQITQSFLKPFDEIPHGHKTICEIKLDDPSLKLLQSKLPVINARGSARKMFLLATGKEIKEGGELGSDCL
ncbi:hypothetical protein PV783_16925 [Chitinophaga sp. CC14]|uniref:hypothetical protein n=1 Tax=Chitinophaga sp. CC14 TaxID=3029199 RepID=UPI003B771453